MSFKRKVLWIVSMDNDADEKRFTQRAQAAGGDTVCIRTDSPQLPGAIGLFHQLGMKAWGWRWPGVIPGNTGRSTRGSIILEPLHWAAGLVLASFIESYL